MNTDKVQFDHAQWHYELIEALGCYRQLIRFCADQAAVRAHLENAGRPRMLSATGEIVGVGDEEIEQFVTPISDSIDNAVEAYRRQLLVIIVSITEAAVAEAFEVLFWFKPQTMKALETQESGLKLGTTLDELMAASDLSSLRGALVEKAVSVAIQGKNKKTVLKRIEKLFGGGFPEATFSDYLALVERRNEIVHENARHIISDEELSKFFDVGTDFIEALGHLLAKHDLPIYDPMRLFSGDDGDPGPDMPDRYVITDIRIL